MKEKNLFGEYQEQLSANNEGEIIEEKKTKEKVFGYNPFPLQDAIGDKSVKKIWLEYQKLRLLGIEADEVIHKIIGKIRDMVAISQGASKEGLGTKDYPFAKSKKDLKNWQPKELLDFYTKMVGIYHYSRSGGDELDIATEKTFLNL